MTRTIRKCAITLLAAVPLVVAIRLAGPRAQAVAPALQSPAAAGTCSAAPVVVRRLQPWEEGCSDAPVGVAPALAAR